MPERGHRQPAFDGGEVQFDHPEPPHREVFDRGDVLDRLAEERQQTVGIEFQLAVEGCSDFVQRFRVRNPEPCEYPVQRTHPANGIPIKKEICSLREGGLDEIGDLDQFAA